MKYEHVELVADEEGNSSKLFCPECGALWVDVDYGDAMVNGGKCEHFMFTWEQNSDPECYNGLTKDILFESIAKAYKKNNDKSLWIDMDNREIANDVYFEKEFWEKSEVKEISMILDHTQEFMCCGPSSMTVLFGVNSKK